MCDDANYRDLAAETYDLWFPGEIFEDTEYFRRAIVGAGGLALEIGCGTGRLLVPYLKDGLPVHGIDSSAAMLAICSSKARKFGLDPVLYQQDMQALQLPHTYRTIYIPFASFMLVADRDAAMETLRRLLTHLDQSGQVLITTTLAWGETRLVPQGGVPAQQEKLWSLRRVAMRPSDGATVLVEQSTVNNYVEQLQQGWYRYQVYLDGKLVDSYLQPMKLRWYFKHELALMLQLVGFRNITVTGDYTDEDASERHSIFLYRAER